jgi:ubiquinone biosynthesis protein
VAIKIQRPGIETIFRADMRNLQRLAAVADFFHLMGLVSIRELASEFDRWTSRELDFRLEGRTADVIRSNATPNEIIPFVYWDLTTSRVLTLEFLEGISLAKIADLVDSGKTDEVRRLLPRMNVREVGRNMAVACLTQFFVTGVFHGDPHPGNVLVREDNTVAFVDFGIFGELGAYEREALASHIENVALGNIDEGYRYYAKLVFASPDADMGGFARQAKSVLRRWYVASQNPTAPVEDKHLGKYSAEMFDAVRKQRLRLAMDTMLFWRALNTLDSTALRLSAVFDLLDELRTFFETIRPTAARRVLDIITDHEATRRFGEHVHSSPGDFHRILDEIARRNQWDSSMQETPELIRRKDTQTRLLAAGILGISLITLAAAIGRPNSVWFAVTAALLYTWIGAKMWCK